ncbi:MAG TPA: hypothetical protein VEF53_03385 [Patescibacteria group bacterium]|nr:hypothetical protein [Patescibacteria group bacterium]
MLRRFQMITLMLVLVIALVGCISKAPSIVGEWHSEQDSIIMAINENGTFSITDETLEDGDLLSGTYRIEGDKFIYTPTDETELVNTFTLTRDTLTLTYKEYSSTFKRAEK